MPYAHSKPNHQPADWQPLADHLTETARRAAEFAKPFGSEEWANEIWLVQLNFICFNPRRQNLRQV